MIQEPKPPVRPYRAADLQRVEKLHEQMGFDYLMPNLNDPLFHVKRVLELDGQVEMAIALKVQAEAYLWLSHDWGSPQERLAAFELLHEATREAGEKAGFDEFVIWLPPELADSSFQKRLVDDLQWSPCRDGWTSFNRRATKDGK